MCDPPRSSSASRTLVPWTTSRGVASPCHSGGGARLFGAGFLAPGLPAVAGLAAAVAGLAGGSTAHAACGAATPTSPSRPSPNKDLRHPERNRGAYVIIAWNLAHLYAARRRRCATLSVK